ncbi:hypothetical protein F4775DRAFT_335980 [Biscogniauxia sp. FL1348]|nr:hypothetical protein F4775DRAFT_335980 [Biscogniauxia sp. FL1348]
MTGETRLSVFMPTIKCSNCGNQVEISMMGDHVCGSAKPAPAVQPTPAPMPDRLGGALSSLKANVFDKFSRTPPSVDTSAANKAFMRTDQLTPLSASTGSHAISPRTPLYARPSTSHGGDDYAPAIAGSPRRPSGFGRFSSESESADADATYGTSPNKQSLLARMDNIAPGPFDHRPRSKSSFGRETSKEYRPVSRGDDSLRVEAALERPSTSHSISSNTSAGGMGPPKMPRKNGYGGFGPPQREGSDELEPPPLGLGKRSETFSGNSSRANDEEMYEEAPARAPSAPGPRPDRLRRPSSSRGEQPAMLGDRSHRPSLGIRDTTRPPPPRKSSIRPSTRHGNNLSVNLAEEFGVNNPYHSPSISQSSSGSGFSHASRQSQPSSTTSPARSTKSQEGTRRPSDTSGLDSLMDDIQNSMGALQSKDGPPSPAAAPRMDDTPDALRPGGNRKTPPEPLRLDPAIQNGQDSRVASPMKSPLTPGLNAGREDPAIQAPRSPLREPAHNRQASRDQRSRGKCKACNELITGKSISSADGRLTGRYHKACFVCTTCQKPFTSSTFYVLDDKPYCEQHYHKLNGSLCGTCHRGIEGQYLEDEAPRKYHPACFRCGDCGIVLRDGYFDVNGRPYCERDAWRRMQAAFHAQQQQQQQRGPPPPRGMPPMSRPPPQGMGMRGEPPMGLPMGGPASSLNRPFGLPSGMRLAPGQALGRGGLGPMPKMEKRRTRLGMM